MPRRHEISDEGFQRIVHLLPGQSADPGVTMDEAANRLFLNALLYVVKTGIPWRDLPERFGKWNSV